MKIEITLKDIESNLESLPEQFLYQVNDFIDFLKYKHLYDQQYDVPEWQKEEVRRRVQYSQKHTESFISESEMNDFLNDFERES